MTIIPDLSDLVLEQVSMTNEVTITVRAASPTAPCPCCGTISKRIQSRYTRTLRDLPASGRPVHLVLHVRRFFCQESTCVRKIFAERFPSLTLPRVKFTLRLQEALREMGFELGGEAGARLGKKLSYPGSPDTILRLVKRAEQPTASAPRVVGLDDWSWKRRLRYGTLICDLESRKPLDVLDVKRDYFCLQTAYHLNQERHACREYSDGTIVFSLMSLRSSGPSSVARTSLK
jgi:transposase